MVLAVNIGESADQVKTYVARHGLTFPHVLDTASTLASWFNVSGTPMSFLVDRSGLVIGGASGYRDWTTQAAHQLIQSLLGQNRGSTTQTAMAKAPWSTADANNADQVAAGQTVYHQHCSTCHGANLEGQPNWKRRLPSGELPAPPHDDTGHTWHHPDQLLFQITKFGGQAVAGSTYKSNMPAFQNVLGDSDIWAVLAFIKSTWSAQSRSFQESANARGR